MVFRDIPLKNYFKYLIIILLTLIICVVLFIIYNNHKKIEDDNSVLKNKVSEIDAQDLDNYIDENEIVLLYFGVVKDESSKKIEEQMLEMIDEDDLDFVYVNISNVKNKKDFLNDFGDKYSSMKKIDNYPAFVYIRDKEIIDVIQREDRDIEKEDVKTFIDTNEIKGEKNA